MNRRDFLVLLPLSLRTTNRSVLQLSQARHPTPRPGISAQRVLKVDELENDRDIIRVFEVVRKIPNVMDGLRCPCRCSESRGLYSLLSCFEPEGMARYCDWCRAAAAFVYKLREDGRTLEQIRRAVDLRWPTDDGSPFLLIRKALPCTDSTRTRAQTSDPVELSTGSTVITARR